MIPTDPFPLIYLQNCVQNHAAITPYLLAIEKIFTELLKTREMVTNIKPSKIKGMHRKLKLEND